MYTYAEEVMKLSSVMTLADKIQKGYKTVIKASAGTGKTYRLSLEYIANMICGISYENIVVMTFTKKATAEIKIEYLNSWKILYLKKTTINH